MDVKKKKEGRKVNMDCFYILYLRENVRPFGGRRILKMCSENGY